MLDLNKCDDTVCSGAQDNLNRIKASYDAAKDPSKPTVTKHLQQAEQENEDADHEHEAHAPLVSDEGEPVAAMLHQSAILLPARILAFTRTAAQQQQSRDSDQWKANLCIDAAWSVTPVRGLCADQRLSSAFSKSTLLQAVRHLGEPG